MIRSLLRRAAVALFLPLAGGCYFSAERVIASGQDIGLEAGMYVCRSDTTENVELLKRTETGSSGPDVIHTMDGTDYRFAAIGGGLYLVQGTEAANFSYAFADFTDRTRLRLLVRDPQVTDRAYELARSHRLRIEPHSLGSDSLETVSGATANVRAFLVAHDRSMLIERVTCGRS